MMSTKINSSGHSVVEEGNASMEKTYVNPFVHTDKEEKQVTAAFIHISEGKATETDTVSKPVENPFIRCDIKEESVKAPAVKAFLREGDPGFDSAISFTTEPGKVQLVPVTETALVPATEATLVPVTEAAVADVKPMVPSAPLSSGEDNLAYKLAKELVARYDIRRCFENLYVRNGTIHEIISDDCLGRLIYSYIESKHGSVKSGHVYEVKKLINMDSSVKEEMNSNPNYISLANIILDNRLRAVTPDRNIFLTHRINASYHPELIGKCPVMNQFIANVMNGNEVLIRRVWQVLAMIFCNAPVKKFVVLYGPHDSGKSIMVNFICELYKHDKFPLDLNNFGDPFILARISGRKLAVCADLPHKVLKGNAVGKVKEITGGDEVNGQEKYGPVHILNTEGGLRLVFSTNHQIVLADSDPAFYERILYLPFLNTVPKEKRDPYLKQKLWAEKDAIVTTALQYLPELLATNFTFAGEEETEALLSVYNAYVNRDFSEIVEGFLAENIELAPDVFTSTEEILNAFTEKTGVYIDSSSFGKYVKSVLLNMSPSITEARATINGTKSRGYRGIRIKE